MVPHLHFRNRSWWRWCCCRKREFTSRTVWIGRESVQKFPPNVIRNQKYNVFTFVPLVSYKINPVIFMLPVLSRRFGSPFQVLFNQFKFFLNLFFLIMACSQFIPQLRVGFLYTYWAPLGFVLSVTLIREAIDDFRR